MPFFKDVCSTKDPLKSAKQADLLGRVNQCI
jgi:hypothetical protein